MSHVTGHMSHVTRQLHLTCAFTILPLISPLETTTIYTSHTPDEHTASKPKLYSHAHLTNTQVVQSRTPDDIAAEPAAARAVAPLVSASRVGWGGGRGVWLQWLVVVVVINAVVMII